MHDLLALLDEMSAVMKAQADGQSAMVRALDTLTRISVATTRLSCTLAEALGASGQLSPGAARQCADDLSEMACALEEQFGFDRLPPDLAVRLQTVARSLRE